MLLNKIVSDVVTDKIQNLKLMSSRMGVVFDLPEKEAKVLLDAYTQARVRKSITFSIEVINELPEIIE